ncbi:hypothetical protein AVEN_81126-1 [Araneus ventricosus]|uniref:Uncharacterized protein n=1 Tax=Araneus ventricosus TaxID=182803 RepID=A0A4Y2N586_ARAVE|nr:hypothetical protein AVEN_81126-1 [Araneus ventricosus]
MGDWTVTTSDPIDYGESSSSADIVLHAIVPVLILGLVLFLVCLCIKHLHKKNWCSAESDSHSSIPTIFSSMQTPPGRRTYLLTAHLREMRRQSDQQTMQLHL